MMTKGAYSQTRPREGEATVLNNQRTSAFRNIAATTAAALFLTACAQDQPSLDNSVRDITVAADTAPAGSVLPGHITAVLARVSPSFITMVVSEPDQPLGKEDGIPRGVSSGSGFAVDSAGHILTAAHVAYGRNYSVRARASNGRIYNGKVVAIKPDNDMGLINIRTLHAPAVVPAASPCLRKGQAVFSLGKPHAQGDTARIGAVKSMHFGRKVRYGRFGYPDAMVLKMATRRGESGGPVFNAHGELVGMIVSTLSAGGRPLNLAHAIPLPPLARFYCAKASCGPRWRKLAAMSTRNCR